MGKSAVDVEFGVSGRGEPLRVEMAVDGSDLTFAQLFARAAKRDRERLLTAVRDAAGDGGSFDEEVLIDERTYRVTGAVSAEQGGLVSGTCEEIG